MADETSVAEAGDVGEDVENILLELTQAADYDVKRAEKGIFSIDEIDKITTPYRDRRRFADSRPAWTTCRLRRWASSYRGALCIPWLALRDGSVP